MDLLRHPDGQIQLEVIRNTTSIDYIYSIPTLALGAT